MKRFAAVLLAVCMAVTLGACKAPKQIGESSTGENKKEEKVEVEGLKVGYLFYGDSEKTGTKARREAIDKMQGTTGLTDSQIIISENVQKKNLEKKVEGLVSKGCSLIFSTDRAYEKYIIRMAKKYTDVQFCQEGGRKGERAKKKGISNYHTFNTRLFEAYHVGGLVAGKVLVDRLNNGKAEPYTFQVGFVAEEKCPEAISCATAFFLGVKRAYSNAKMYIRYVGSKGVYDDDAKEAKQLVLAGVSVMGEFTSTTAVAAVCAENGIPVVGCDVGMIDVAPKDALTSAVSDWSVYYNYAVNQVQNGQDIDADWSAGYAEGANIITQLNDEHIAEGTVEEVKDLEKNIRAGKAKIFNTKNFTIGEQKLEDLVKNNGDYKKFKGAVKGGQYLECSLNSAPDWDVLIDGSEVSDYDYVAVQEQQQEEMQSSDEDY